MVLLNLKNLALAQLSHKFSPCWSLLMKVMHLIKDTSVELKIPDDLSKVFPVFLVSMVKPHVPSDVTKFPDCTHHHCHLTLLMARSTTKSKPFSILGGTTASSSTASSGLATTFPMT
ncbi:hypothetical protein BC828DRAFT_419615 [Blastocladiella britannica]|nr:hypothetical protein BC828DRAFT_419615 [Blastocladiella britannica]